MSTLAQLLIAAGNSDYVPGTFYPEEGGYYIGERSYPDGDYAIFVAPKSAEAERIWCNANDILTNPGVPAAQAAFDGYTNSVAIVALGLSWAAAHYCRNYAGGGHGDWYLAARGELVFIAQSSASSMPAGSGQGFRTDKAYWTSTWSGSSAYQLTFYSGSFTLQSKETSLVVRPIRKKLIFARARQIVLGSALVSGSTQFVVPDGVTSISVLVVDAGGNGTDGGPGSSGGGSGGVGGSRGQARYLNNIPVTPGQIITGAIAASGSEGTSSFGSYTGWTPIVVTPVNPYYAMGGTSGSSSGPGNQGQDLAGYNLQTPSVNTGYGHPWPGGGGGGGAGSAGGGVGPFPPGSPGSPGGGGAIRIIWPGDRRGFPSTDTTDEFEV